MRLLLLRLHMLLYENVARRVIFRLTAQEAHRRTLRLLAWLDESPLLVALLARLRRLAFAPRYTRVGGVMLPHPLILAAGLVKGEGFAGEADALAAVETGQNIVPGWRSVPALVGLVEFGSFTPQPRLGNPGEVVWRDAPTRSTQNRVGLKNPGARAAAAFLARRRRSLPPTFGINIAPSPGVAGAQQQENEVLAAISAFLEADISPSWFTLNLSCPNTEDDPGGHQTENHTRRLCAAVVGHLGAAGCDTPLWVKLSPELAPEQYHILMRVFHETGVRAVIATNTLPRPAPTDPALVAGIGGGRLHHAALDAVRCLSEARTHGGYAVDIIACGGVLDGAAYRAFCGAGAAAAQYWSALIYRGPLAAAIIESES